jgi:uncharacterized membrane protein
MSVNRIVGRSVERIAALSDGVFAIAMTLIVLEIHVPDRVDVGSESELWVAVSALAPRFTTYLLSFLTLGIFWHGQQTQLANVERSDHHYSWLHVAFLALVALMPFSTSLLAEFISFRLALGIYWLNIALLGAAIYVLWSYAKRAGLVRPGTPPEVDAAIRRRVVGAQALYVFGALLCVFSTYWSIAFIVAVQLMFATGLRLPLLSRI